jgi:hypothetical protein
MLTPFYFESNKGQTDPQVKYLLRGDRYAMHLTSTEAVFVFHEALAWPDSQAKAFVPRAEDAPKAGGTKRSVMRMELIGANPDPEIVGQDILPGRANYFVGNNPQNWIHDAPTFRSILYKEIYPGIDVLFYSRQQELEYDFIVSAGSDPGRICILFKGATSAELDEKGGLNLKVGSGTIYLRPPIIYQEQDGTRRGIDGGYSMDLQGRIGIRLGSYDRNRPLIIDTVLSYSTLLGGTQNEIGRGIAVDAAGNAYVTGTTPSMDFPTTSSAYDGSYNDNGDIYVTKFNPAGSALVYSTYVGGLDYDWAHDIVLDNSGNAYVTGYSHSFDFPATPGALQTTKGGGTSNIEDAIVFKLNPAGSSLVFSTFLGGDQLDWGEGIALDNQSNVYVTGMTMSTVFPTTENAFDTVPDGNGDVFVSKISADGSQLLYSTYLGGALQEYGFDIALDADNNAYIAGRTQSQNFPTTSGAYQTSHKGGTMEAFVTKLNATGTGLIYSTYLGGSGWDFGHGIALDSAGNAYVTGGTASFDFPSVNAFQASNNGPLVVGGDAFAAKFNSSGSSILYSTFLGGSGTDEGHSITLDSTGKIYVAGLTHSYDFPTSNPLQDQLCQGCTNVNSADAFVTVIDETGANLSFSTYLGGIQYDWAHAIALDPLGNIYIVGDTASDDFPTTPGAYQRTRKLDDAFVAKIETPLSFPWEIFYPALIRRIPPSQ